GRRRSRESSDAPHRAGRGQRGISREARLLLAAEFHGAHGFPKPRTVFSRQSVTVTGNIVSIIVLRIVCKRFVQVAAVLAQPHLGFIDYDMGQPSAEFGLLPKSFQSPKRLARAHRNCSSPRTKRMRTACGDSKTTLPTSKTASTTTSCTVRGKR